MLLSVFHKDRHRSCLCTSKIWLIMRLTTLLLTVAIMQTSAEAFSQQTITLSKKEATIETVFKNFREQAGYNFLYSNSVVNESNPVNIHVKNVSLKEALDQCLRNQPLSYHIINKTVVVEVNHDKLQQLAPVPIKVTGIVTDENGAPLPGVSIQVKNTRTGTITDAKGNFTITVKDKQAVLVFTYIGYTSVEKQVGEKTRLKVKLKPANTGLNQLVVIGYGTQTKKDLTGNISTVSGEDFERVPATNPLQAIQGKVPGLSITPKNGLPGEGSSVIVNGVQSINGTNAPIYVVDGVITNSIQNINPGDIESISVLKDASSTAIYGARAANGVIIVHTKRGKGLTSPKITFRAYGGVQTEGNPKLHLLNAKQFLELYTEAYTNDGITVPWTQADLDYYKGVNTNWLDLITRTGYIQHYNLSVGGGSDHGNYYVSGGYLTNKGRVLGTDYNKFTLQFNSDHDINKWIHFGNSLQLFATTANGTNGTDAPYQVALTKVPITRAYADNGDYAPIHNTELEHQYANPVFLAKENVNRTVSKGFLGNIYLTLDLMEGLKFTARGNAEWQHGYATQFTAGISPTYQWEGSNKNFVQKEETHSLHWITDFTLDYNKVFNDIHKLHVLLGYSNESYTSENLLGSRSNTPNNSIQFLDAGDPTTMINKNGTGSWAFSSVFGRLNYSYKDRYLFTGTLRRDGSSRLASGHRFGLFPSAAVAWRLSDEQFMQNLTFIDNLKLRVSWGKVGNVLSLSEYATVPSLTQWNYVFNEAPALGYTGAEAVNQNINWESTTKKNIGLDASLFRSRLYTTIDYYIGDTRELLFKEAIPASTGYSNQPFINAGHVRNSGVQVQLGYRGKTGDWNYDVSVNMSHNKNKVIDLGGQDLRTQGLIVGYPVKSYFGYEAAGLFYTQAQLDKYPHSDFKQIGDIRIKDIDGTDADGNLTGKPDGEITPADRSIIGRKYPNITYGTFASVGYKNWTLQLQLQGIQGISRNILGAQKDLFNYFTSWAENNAAIIMNRYNATKNPDGTWPRLSKSDEGHNREFSSFWLRDASFLRIRNINLNYNFPSTVLKALNMEQFGVYVSVENLYTFTHFIGSSVDTEGDSFTGIPLPRTFTFGLTASF